MWCDVAGPCSGAPSVLKEYRAPPYLRPWQLVRSCDWATAQMKVMPHPKVVPDRSHVAGHVPLPAPEHGRCLLRKFFASCPSTRHQVCRVLDAAQRRPVGRNNRALLGLGVTCIVQSHGPRIADPPFGLGVRLGRRPQITPLFRPASSQRHRPANHTSGRAGSHSRGRRRPPRTRQRPGRPVRSRARRSCRRCHGR